MILAPSSGIRDGGIFLLEDVTFFGQIRAVLATTQFEEKICQSWPKTAKVAAVDQNAKVRKEGVVKFQF